MSTRGTSTDYRHPYRPLPIRAFNAMGRAAGTLGWSNTLEVEALVDGAKRKTGSRTSGTTATPRRSASWSGR